jgi:DNA-binding NarL/FixJ family response regulator
VAEVVARWRDLKQPWPAAYAGLRHAEALLAGKPNRTAATQALRQAHGHALTLGARPLQAEIEQLAQRSRLSLATPAPSTPPPEPSAAAALGLTRREQQVLRLVAAGLTNRQIADTLFISVKTAGLHVSHILAKLGVAGRVEAATTAHRIGLDRAPSAEK